MSFTTSRSLLNKVRNGDDVSWSEFYETYKPLILLCGKDHSLSEAEKEDLIQNIMYEIFQKNIIEKYDPDRAPENLTFKYDPAKGRFRHYLRGIIRNQALKIIYKRNNLDSLDAEDAPVPAEELWVPIWEEEWRRHILNEALKELKNEVESKTYSIFEMYFIQDRPVQEVTKLWNVSASSVYTVKCRCLPILKRIINQLEEN